MCAICRATHNLLHGSEQVLAKLNLMEEWMSQLTDKVDSALATLQADEADEQARLDGAIAAAGALQEQVNNLQADKEVDEAALQRVLDVLASLSTPAGQPPAPPVSVDPTPVDESPAPASDTSDQPTVPGTVADVPVEGAAGADSVSTEPSATP